MGKFNGIKPPIKIHMNSTVLLTFVPAVFISINTVLEKKHERQKGRQKSMLLMINNKLNGNILFIR